MVTVQQLGQAGRFAGVEEIIVKEVDVRTGFAQQPDEEIGRPGLLVLGMPHESDFHARFLYKKTAWRYLPGAGPAPASPSVRLPDESDRSTTPVAS